jgi:hypothetical protein
LTKIHKILKFDHSECIFKYLNLKGLLPFIEKNTQIRKESTNPSEKDQAKLMNNSIFGKSMENILGRSNFKMFGSSQMNKIIKHLNNPEMKDTYPISDDMILIEMEKQSIIYNKPTYTGKKVKYIFRFLHFRNIKMLAI